MATDTSTRKFSERYPFYHDKFVTLYNCFDPEDFSGGKIGRQSEQRLHLLYTGAVGVDRHSPVSLLEAVCRVIEKHPKSQETIRIEFIGQFILDKNYWKKRLGKVIELTGPLSHDACMSKIRKASVLVAIVHRNEGGMSAIPSKLFEYMASQRPVLALAPSKSAMETKKRTISDGQLM